MRRVGPAGARARAAATLAAAAGKRRRAELLGLSNVKAENIALMFGDTDNPTAVDLPCAGPTLTPGGRLAGRHALNDSELRAV